MACAQPFLIKNPHYNEKGYFQFWKEYIEVPCGWCLNCRVDRQNWLSDAMQYEFKKYNYIGAFVTFTYDDIHILELANTNTNDFYQYINDNNEVITAPYYSEKQMTYSLRKKDAIDFLKRVRSKINYLYEKHNIKNIDLCRKDFRYSLAGEYGDCFGRPHYHFCFFGLDYEFCKEIFESCWQKGLIDSKPIQSGCFNYITKYLTKQVKGEQAIDMFDNQGLERPFFTHSLGLGKGLILEQKDFILKNNLCYLTQNDTLRPIPIYYRNYFFKIRPKTDYSKTAENMLEAGIKPDLKLDQYYMTSKGVKIKYSLKKMNDYRKAQALIRHQNLERMLEKRQIQYTPLNFYELESCDTSSLAIKALKYTVVDGEIIPF